MKMQWILTWAASITFLLCVSQADAGGFKGRAGGAAKSFKASGRGGNFSGAAKSFKAAGGRSSVPNLSAAHSAAGNRNLSSANLSALKSRSPNLSSMKQSHPNFSVPKGNLPSGGLKPSTRPSSPSTRPGSSLQNNPFKNSDAFKNAKDKLPTNRPSHPNLGGNDRPNFNLPDKGDIKLPGNGGINRPGNGGGITRPSDGGGLNRPGNGGVNRPGNGGGIQRPSAGDLGDFLNLKGSIHAPNLSNHPDFKRPNNSGNKIGGIGNQIGSNNLKNVNINNIKRGNNTIINNRPSWVKIDNSKNVQINRSWQNNIGGVRNWAGNHPERVTYINGWGNSVRRQFNPYVSRRYFSASWWGVHPHATAGWYYGNAFGRYPANYWWRRATYASCVRWFTWSAPAAVWDSPLYYDYGDGGNVTYNNNMVSINDAPVASSSDFAQSAMDLATVSPPASEDEAAAAEWMPLGVFAVSSSEKDVEPTRVVQLAVNKAGVISGTLYNSLTDLTSTVQGQVDKDTQRVAMRIGESDTIVVETGLYNLTQDNASILVHFGDDKTENWMLVRMQDQDANAQPQSP